LRIVEVGPADWRLVIVFDHAIEVICEESFPSREQAIEVITDRLIDCVDADQIRTGRVQ
jgi:hypothetical protein